MLLVPALLVIAFLAVFPLIYSFVLTFTDHSFSIASSGTSFIGLGNWARLASDSRFHNSVWVTFQLAVVALVLQYLLGLGLALLLNQRLRGLSPFRALLLLPMMLSPVATAFIVGRMLMAPEGPLNTALAALGLPALAWFGQPGLVIVSIALVDSWEWTPLFILLIYAALRAIPTEIYEAATADGASTVAMFRFITLPLIAPVSIVAILIRALMLVQAVDIPLITTGGGPGLASETLSLYAYNLGWRNFDLGYASTVGYAQLGLTIVVTMVCLYLLRRQMHVLG